MKIVRKTSKCKGCPLDGATTHKVWGQCDINRPELVFVGEAPGADEDERGVPFVGAAGRMLKKGVEDVGHLWHRSHKTNTIVCRPPKNKIGSPEGIEAQIRCKAGLFEELYTLYKSGVKVIVATGGTALKAFGITGSIHKLRGSVFMLTWDNAETSRDGFEGSRVLRESEEVYDMLLLPTFHPAYLLWDKNPKHEVTFINDLEKAYDIADNGYEPPLEEFTVFPTIEEIEAFTEELLKRKPPLGIDLETSGFVPGHAAVIVVGVAIDGQKAFSIPFLKQGGKSYWDPEKRKRAHECLRLLMSECPTVYQNALFDARHLLYLKAPAEKIQHDVMILHHCLSPELPHNLGYIVSTYGKTPYWKGEVMGNPKAMINMDDETLRTYNLRDSVVLHQVLNDMLQDAKESGVYHLYKNIAMPLVEPIMTMIENGILLDKSRLKKWKASLRAKERRLLAKLKEIADLPEGFNLDSGDHLRYLLFSVVPSQYEKAKQEMESYNDPDSKKKKNTKKYKALRDTVETFEHTTPFRKLPHTPLKTDSGSIAVSEEAMLNLQTAAINRIAKLQQLRKRTKEKEQELAERTALRDFITAYREYKGISKLLTTYTSFPTGADDRVRSPYRITGTATGRLSSGNRKGGEAGNMQNIPPEAKHLFVAPEGYHLVQLDYSNLELRVMAEISNDDVLREVFKKGLNVHTENTKLMFGIDEDHPLWKAARRACKTYIFGRNYGGGLKGIHTRVMKAVPELNLTYAHFCEIDDAYRKAHPAYDRWYNETVERVKTDRCLTNPFGRTRYFLGREAEIIREGLNFPIQSTAADIINMAMITLHKMYKKGQLQARMIGQVHDSLLFEIKRGKVKQETRIIKEVMERPVDINGKSVSFPVDAESGLSWGELKELKV